MCYYQHRKTTVSSKSKQCPKVYVLHLSRDSVLKRSSSSGSTWKVVFCSSLTWYVVKLKFGLNIFSSIWMEL